MLHVGQPLRVGDDRFRGRTHLVVELGRLDLQGADTFRERGERLAPGQRGDRGAERVLRATFELRVRRFERGAVRLRVGEDLLVGRELRLLVCVFDHGGSDLLELVAQQVELARPRTVVATQLGQLGLDPAAVRVGLGERGPRDRRRLAREPVEHGALLRGVEKGLVRVLAVQVDEVAAACAELTHRREVAVDVPTGAARRPGPRA